VPQQALFLLNSPFAVEQARGLAARPEVAAAPDEAAKTVALYRLIFARPPTADEIKVGVDFLAAASGREGAKLNPWEQYAQLLLWTNEVMYVD
jgi:hypothetical protein